MVCLLLLLRACCVAGGVIFINALRGKACATGCGRNNSIVSVSSALTFSPTSHSVSFQPVCHLSLSLSLRLFFISPWTVNTEPVQSFWSWLLARSQVSSCPVQLNDTHLPHTWLSSPSLQLPSWPYMGEFISVERGRSR